MRGPRVLGVAAAGLMSAAVLMAGAMGVMTVALGGSGSTSAAAPSALASSDIPAGMLVLYTAAAATCPGLSWTVLAAIGTVESGNGTSNLPGVHSGANEAGAEGPMQFEPTTFATYDQPIPPGGADPPSPYDPTDAVYAAAKMLCADGAAGGTDITGALFAYNHSQAYVTEVLNLAQRYGQAPAPGAADPTGGTSQTGDIAAAWALGQVGIPYVWGGESPGVGFDCSGLAQAAYKAAVFTLPRVAQDQYDAGPLLAAGSPLEPGDLVFFGASSAAIDHVGLYVGTQDGQALMVDAPHTGADVRVEPFPTAIGAAFGDQLFVGATDPAG